MGKKGISRREFLKGTAASALGVAALGLLGGCAAEEKPAGTLSDSGSFSQRLAGTGTAD